MTRLFEDICERLPDRTETPDAASFEEGFHELQLEMVAWTLAAPVEEERARLTRGVFALHLDTLAGGCEGKAA